MLSMALRPPGLVKRAHWIYTEQREYGPTGTAPGNMSFLFRIGEACNVIGLLKARDWIRREAEQAFYEQNAFHFDGDQGLGFYVNGTGLAQLGWLKEVLLH